MPTIVPVTNFGRGLLVTSFQALIRCILFPMGLDHALIDFFVRAAVGAAAAMLVILCAGLGIPHRAQVGIRRPRR